MKRFLYNYIIRPLAGRWLKGFLLLLFWTVAFVALPALSAWFLAASSIAFLTANTLFAYLIPSSIIRLLTLMRTTTRYFERLENHKTTLDAQRNLQLLVFNSVARLPFFKKQVNNNSNILDSSTYGIDLILNHILLWLLPLSALIITVLLYGIFIALSNQMVAIEFLISSALLLFLVPQFIFRKNRIHYESLKRKRDENNHSLTQSFRGRVEISKYNLEAKAITQYEHRLQDLEQLEMKLQTNAFTLQLIVGLGFSFIATFVIWSLSKYQVDASLAVGAFFGMLAQAELSEMLFAGKSEKSSVAHQINDLGSIIESGKQSESTSATTTDFERVTFEALSAGIPETTIQTNAISLTLQKGDWVGLYGETGKGKTTLLNSLFYPEYRLSGKLIWNSTIEIPQLYVPQCIYVTQKAYLLTGTLRENFEGYPDNEILMALEIVDLKSWYTLLPEGLDTWLGENGETLSGGQRKKLLLAQALLKNPQLLVVDEPTAGISTENAIAIFEQIKKHRPDITLLMATHLRDFTAVFDKVVRL